jgi:transcription antitermination factor NusG
VFTDAVCLPRWFAVYVKPRHEKSVAVALAAKGHEAFAATYTKYHTKTRYFDIPLFPGYVFCRIQASQILSVMTTPGVFSIVGSGRTPQAIAEEEIERVTRMLKAAQTTILWPYVRAGQEVCLRSGPLRGLTGVIVDGGHQAWLVVSVHLLQRSIAVKIQREFVSLEPEGTRTASETVFPSVIRGADQRASSPPHRRMTIVCRPRDSAAIETTENDAAQSNRQLTAKS